MSTLPAPPPLDHRKRKHSMATVRLARKLYGDGDAWTPSQIRDYLAEQGIRVHRNTVALWVVPGLDEHHRRQNNDSYRRRRAGQPRLKRSETPLLDRMLEMRAAGLSFTAVANMMRLDYGLDMTTDTARYYVRAGREPRLPAQRARRAA